MKYDLLDNLTRQQEALFATVQKLNQLSVANVEKLTALQMAALRNYSDVSLGQLKALAEVKNPQALQGYLSQQGESLKALSEKTLADARAAAEIGVEYHQQAQQIARESFEAATRKAA